VLVLGDADDVGELLTGYAVTTVGAASAGEALALLEAQRFDALVLDIARAGGEGFELLRALRASPRLRRVPVVLLSDSSSARRSARSGWFPGP
jgi:CheY-like chemotaxis protein